jgi:hypothetical protein
MGVDRVGSSFTAIPRAAATSDLGCTVKQAYASLGGEKSQVLARISRKLVWEPRGRWWPNAAAGRRREGRARVGRGQRRRV